VPHFIYALPPPDDPPLARGRAHRGIGVPGSVLLLLAMFLPALRVCNEPFYPLEAPMLLAPYLFGGTALAVFLATAPGTRRVWGILARVLGGLTLAMVGLIAHLVAFEGEPLGVVLAIAWWPAAIAFARTCRGPAPAELRLARAVALPGLGATVWFAVFLADKSVMWGMGVAFLGALLTTAGAVVWELDVRGQLTRDLVDPMPRAIVR